MNVTVITGESIGSITDSISRVPNCLMMVTWFEVAIDILSIHSTEVINS